MADLNYTRRIGDRKDGRLLRTLSPVRTLMPYVNKSRSSSINYSNGSIEVTAVDYFIKQKRLDGYPGLGILHFLIAVYVRTAALRPAINRFVSGMRIFSRNNIEVVLNVKRTSKSDAAETFVKIQFLPTDTIYDVYRKFNDKVAQVRAADTSDGDAQTLAGMVKAPRIILRMLMRVLGIADYFGWLPQSLLDSSPYHGSLLISDLGSLGSAPVYHHLYEFGNIPMAMTFGSKRRAYEWDSSAQPTIQKYIDYTLTVDERICDDFYFVSAMKYIKHFAKHPQLLEQPPETVAEDVF